MDNFRPNITSCHALSSCGMTGTALNAGWRTSSQQMLLNHKSPWTEPPWPAAWRLHESMQKSTFDTDKIGLVVKPQRRFIVQRWFSGENDVLIRSLLKKPSRDLVVSDLIFWAKPFQCQITRTWLFLKYIPTFFLWQNLLWEPWHVTYTRKGLKREQCDPIINEWCI